MKIKATILSISFLMLTMFPCTETESADVCGVEVHYHMQGNQGHSDTDLCSPFCLCLCCNTNITTNHNLNYALLAANQQVHKTIYRGISEKDILHSLLQPPQA
jgi:hypothetical protein